MYTARVFMSDLSAARPPAAEPQRPSGFFANLIDLYFAPAAAFANLLRKPNFLAPLLLHLALSLAFTGIWLQKVDLPGFFAARMQESGRTASIPAERMEQIEKWTRGSSWGFAVLVPLIVAFGLGGLFLFVFRFFYASEVSYPQSVTIVASSFAAVALLTTPLMLGVLALKGDWTIQPQDALQANLTLLLERQATAKWLWALCSSLDLFSFWLLSLLASGFGAASKRSWTWALPGVVVPWALYVCAKVALVAFR
jgi:hypothetical protein